MKVLVTGAAGFIGSHLCEALLSRGNDVVGLDNFDPFYSRVEKETNLVLARNDARFTFLEADICDVNAVERVFSGTGRIDVVIHLAALAGVRPSLERPSRYQEVNVNGLSVVLEAMRRHDVKKLLFASSSSVYGNNAKVPFAEDDTVDRPISPYAATKKAGELLCHVYHHVFGFSVHCLRFFTVYGPRQRPDLAIRKFSELMLDGEAISVFGDGSSSRDFTYIDDIVSGIMGSLDHLDGYEIFNLGGNRTTSVTRLIALLEDVLHVKARCRHLPAQPGDVERTYADIGKAGQKLGYCPKTPIEAGLRIFAEWLTRKRLTRVDAD